VATFPLITFGDSKVRHPVIASVGFFLSYLAIPRDDIEDITPIETVIANKLVHIQVHSALARLISSKTDASTASECKPYIEGILAIMSFSSNPDRIKLDLVGVETFLPKLIEICVAAR
jgi:hypothetical protein